MRFRIHSSILALILFALSGAALAQTYPSRPIKIVVPFSPGGGTDIQLRIIAPKLAEAMGQPIIIENRPGASTTIGTMMVVGSPPDGYTLVAVDTALTSNPALYPKLPYDTIADLAPVILLTSGASAIVVHPSVPAKTLKEFIALTKTKKDLAYASAGAGTASHLTGELFKLTAGIDLIHVPYKGAGPAVNDTVAGQVAATFTSVASSKNFIDSGRLRALAVTGDIRSQALPQVPTFSEAGLPAVGQASSYWGVLAPAATPREIIVKLNTQFNKVLQLPEIRERLTEMGFNVVGGPSEDYVKHIAENIPKWKRVVREANIKLD